MKIKTELEAMELHKLVPLPDGILTKLGDQYLFQLAILFNNTNSYLNIDLDIYSEMTIIFWQQFLTRKLNFPGSKRTLKKSSLRIV
jgi:hypothetical protein